ncbi:hypothetical protein Q7P36_004729 [Cladosporium allicinum]
MPSPPPPKTILVTSASGNIGRALIPLLLSTTPATLILPTSSAARLKSSLALKEETYKSSRVIVSEGPVSDPLYLQSLCTTHKVSSVFLNLGGQDELFTTLSALEVFARAPSVKHVVYLSAAGDFTSPGGVRETMERWGACASVVVKVAVELRLMHLAAAASSDDDDFGFRWSVVGPTLFFENDVRTKDLLIGEGVMPEPLGEKGVSRVSCADVARAVAACVEDGGERLGGRKVNVGSLRRFTGAEIEGLWTKSLGREVRMGKGDEEGLRAYEEHWEGVIGGVAGRAVGRDLSCMARGWVEAGYGLSEDEYRFCRAVLGKEVDDYEGWVVKMGRKLRGEEVGGGGE